jgi:hypothetical protein
MNEYDTQGLRGMSTGETRSTEPKTCPGAAVFIPHVAGMDRGFRGDRLATECQRYDGTASLALQMRRTSYSISVLAVCTIILQFVLINTRAAMAQSI